MAGLVAFRPERMVRFWVVLSARQARFLGVVFMVAGLGFCGFALAQSGAGNLAWQLRRNLAKIIGVAAPSQRPCGKQNGATHCRSSSSSWVSANFS
jgi:hypothetical protein